MRFTMTLVVAAFSLVSCAEERNQDPDGAKVLWDKINAAKFSSWARAPGFETKQPSRTAHGNGVEIFLNEPLAIAIKTKGLKIWPVGAIVVKNIYADETKTDVAVMEKRSDGWYYAEYGPLGDIKVSGRPGVCSDCHDSGNDGLRAVAFAK